MALTKIKMIRLQKDIRQWDLAREIGIAETYLSKIETGKVKPDPDLLKRIAKALDVSPVILKENEEN